MAPPAKSAAKNDAPFETGTEHASGQPLGSAHQAQSGYQNRFSMQHAAPAKPVPAIVPQGKPATITPPPQRP